MKDLIKENKNFVVKFVGIDKNPVRTIGGLKITPDCSLEEINIDNSLALLLPGSTTWNKTENQKILNIALNFINKGILVGAVCGATLALAELDILNNFKHTSNSVDYLKMFSKNYNGEKLYVDEVACIDKNLATASAAGGLLWAKLILEYLDIYPSEKLESWYKYYQSGQAKYLMDLIS
jgi:putative intracellular protease/amidase